METFYVLRWWAENGSSRVVWAYYVDRTLRIELLSKDLVVYVLDFGDLERGDYAAHVVTPLGRRVVPVVLGRHDDQLAWFVGPYELEWLRRPPTRKRDHNQMSLDPTSTKTAIAIVDADLDARTASLRSIRDRAFARWPAHVNLLFPGPADVDRAMRSTSWKFHHSTQIAEFLHIDPASETAQFASPAPFMLVLDRVDAFFNADGATFHLCSSDPAACIALRTHLLDGLGLHDRAAESFAPHLTLGQCAKSAWPGLKPVIEAWVATHGPFRIDVDRVTFLARTDTHDEMTPVGEVPFQSYLNGAVDHRDHLDDRADGADR